MQASNYVQKGRVLSLVAPYSRTAGQAAMIGSLLGVAHYGVTNGEVGVFDFEGTWDLEKTSAQAWTLGDKVYWNTSTKVCSNIASDGPLVGVAMAAAANPSAAGRVRLNGTPPETASAVLGGQTAVADLIDNGGGAAADGTIAIVTAPTLTDWNGSSVHPSAAQGTAISAAITALTAAVKELSAKQNVILARLRSAGIIAT